MAFTDFTLENVEAKLGVTMLPGELFPGLEPVAAPDWLVVTMGHYQSSTPLTSEKSRSEAVVYPILVAAEGLVPGPMSVFSGHRLDVDASRGLVGECDFILARTERLPRLKAPLLTVVEAKKQDIDAGLGQCIAQMTAAAEFNKLSGVPIENPYGCVTNGIEWQFLRLDGKVVTVQPDLFFTLDLPRLLGALRLTLLVGI